jgi:DNA mismatch endonuclease, patch repair protein
VREAARRRNRDRDGGSAHVNTGPDLALRRIFHRHRFRYGINQPLRVDVGRSIRPDLAFYGPRDAVLVDGCFSHSRAEHGVQPTDTSTDRREKLGGKVARDRRGARRSALAGRTVLGICEHEPPDESAERGVSVLEP